MLLIVLNTKRVSYFRITSSLCVKTINVIMFCKDGGLPNILNIKPYISVT